MAPASAGVIAGASVCAKNDSCTVEMPGISVTGPTRFVAVRSQITRFWVNSFLPQAFSREGKFEDAVEHAPVHISRPTGLVISVTRTNFDIIHNIAESV